MEKLQLTVNGLSRSVDYEGKESLLEILREKLQLTGAKEGCGYGACGTCVVVVNKEAVFACTYRGRDKLSGADVTTIEGMTGVDGTLHPIQQAFVETGAIQCGFCTPGFVLRLHALFQKNLDASDEEILAELKKHICRCTGYEAIWEAAKLAQKILKEKM